LIPKPTLGYTNPYILYPRPYNKYAPVGGYLSICSIYIGHPAIQTCNVSPTKGKNGFYAVIPHVPTANDMITDFFILSIGSVTFYSSFGANEKETAIICK
jgi:hypothetical protein